MEQKIEELAPDLSNFKSISQHINALPEPLRRYITDLETNADPAGHVRYAKLMEDENRQLRELIYHLKGDSGEALAPSEQPL